MRGIPALFSLATALCLWWLCSCYFGSAIIPSPLAVGETLLELAVKKETWTHLAITILRGMAGLGSAFFCAVILGISAGSSPTVMRLLNPLVAALQSCPPILWITLLMVLAGTGSHVPMAVVFATVFPPLFANIAQGCMSMDKRLFDMAKVYRVPRSRVLCKIVLPGLTPYALAGLSYAASASWKVTAVAEYLGSSTGIGAKIFWAYRMLEIPELFAWASIVILLGVLLELLVIAPLRIKAETFTGKVREPA